MSALAPPHMKTSSAAFAPHSAPDTGASTIATPASASRRPVASVSHGSDDDVSSSSAPGRRPCSRPSVAFDERLHDCTVRHHRDDDVAARAPARPACAPPCASGSGGGDFGGTARARRRTASSRGRRRRGATPSAGPSRRDRRSRATVGAMSWRSGLTRKPARRTGRRARSRAGKHCTGRRSGNDTLFGGRDGRFGDDHMKALRLLAPLAAAFALLAGAPGASAQTVLTMSSWVPPTHSLTRDVLQAWAKQVEQATQRPRQVRDAAQAPVGASRGRSTRCATASSTSRSSPRATRRRAIRCR